MLYNRGRYREAVQLAQGGLAEARRMGIERTSGSILTQNRAEPLLELGDIARVEQLLAKDLTLRTHRVFRAYTTATRVQALAWRGRLDEAETLMNEWRPRMHQIAEAERQVRYSLWRTDMTLCLNRGDAPAAAVVLTGVLDDTGPVLGQQSRLLLEGGWVVAMLRAQGSGADATALADRVRSAWHDIPATLRPDGWQVLLEGLLAAMPDALRSGIEIADQDGMPVVFRVILRHELARTLIVAGDRAGRAEASDLLTEAAALATEYQHAGLQRDVAALADAAGFAEQSAEGLAMLTARENQVFALMAEGLSNRQIGERLFISVKTVSVHVSAVLRKLGVATRNEAAARYRALTV